MKLIRLLVATAFITAPVFAKDNKAASYQMGTYITSSVAGDGTITNTLHGDGTTVAGSIYSNHVTNYRVQVPDGAWTLETYTQNKDSMLRQMGMTPMHFKAEKSNPLDVLKGGERVLFRTESHRKLNGVEISVYVPYADNPNKEFRFIGYYVPNASAVQSQPQKATDNVSAMCSAHKLSPELEKVYCGHPVSTANPIPSASTTQGQGKQ